MKKITIAITALLSCSLAVISFCLWQPTGIERGSLTYFLKIPSEVKAFSLWAPTGTAYYGLSLADGVSTNTVTLNYITDLNLDAAQEYARKEGLSCLVVDSNNSYCKLEISGGKFIEVSLKWQTKLTHISTNFIGY